MGTTCGLNQATDQQNTDPLLGPLADNGGDVQTHELLTGSPAINAGDNSVCPATDARGVARSDGQCDAGAYEETTQGAAPMQPLARGASKVALSLPKGALHRPALTEGTSTPITRTHYVFGTMRVAMRVQGEPEPLRGSMKLCCKGIGARPILLQRKWTELFAASLSSATMVAKRCLK